MKHVQTYPIEQFGAAADGTPLKWIVISPTGSGPWPTVTMYHIGGFLGGAPTDGPLIKVAEDLAAAGILCFSVGYRLDRNHVQGQTTNCYWPHQSDDAFMASKAALIDSRCNGKLGAVGGSAGATHAATLAIQTYSEGYVSWSASDRVLASIALSPPTQFDNRDPWPELPDFVTKLSAYCNTTDLELQRTMSPTFFMDNTCSPLFIVAAETEPMPIAQYNSIKDKITELSIPNSQTRLVPGSKHAFANWAAVKADAIPWLKARLA